MSHTLSVYSDWSADQVELRCWFQLQANTALTTVPSDISYINKSQYSVFELVRM